MAVTVTETMQRRLGWLTFWLAIASLICGVIGFVRVGPKATGGLDASVLDMLYQSIRILRLGISDTHGDVFLEVGRWLGVLFLFSVIVTFLLPRLEYLWRRLRARTARNHLVLIGSGSLATAHLSYLGKEETVLMSDKRELDPYDLIENTGCRLPRYIAGDIESQHHLRSMAIHRARRMIIAAGDDALNLSIAWQSLALLDRLTRKTPLPVYTHIENFRMIDQLIEALPNSDQSIIRPFSLPMMACRALAASHPFVLTGWYGPVRQPHWLFLGFDRYAEALLVYGIKMRPPLSGAGLRVTIVSKNAQSTLNTLLDSYPAARELLDQVDVRSDVTEALDPGAYESCDRIGNTLQQTAIFVFAPNDSEAYTTARKVRLRTQTQNFWRVPVFMRLDNAKRFSPGIKSLKHMFRGDEVIEAFGETDELSQAQRFIDWQEDYAQKLHEDYRQLYSGTDHRSRQAFDPKTGWHELTEQTRETNRRAVEHFVLNLVLNGYQYLGGKPVLGRKPQFAEEQWADIARREHMSWTADKHLNGWRYNPIRNDRRQHHDCLRPFESLGEEVRKDLSQFSVIARQIERAEAAITLLPEFRFGIMLVDAVPTEKTIASVFKMLDEAMADSWQGQAKLLQFRLGQLNLGTNSFPAQLPAELKRRGEALQQVATTRIDLFLSSEAEQTAQSVVDHRNEYRADWERAIHDSPGIDRWLDLPSMGHGSDQPGELITEMFCASCHLTITLSSTDIRVEQATTMPYRDVFLPSLGPKKQ